MFSAPSLPLTGSSADPHPNFNFNINPHLNVMSNLNNAANVFAFTETSLNNLNNSLGSLNTSSLNADPNSPELFKQNLLSAQHEVIRLQTLAKQALSGVENAYKQGYSPEDTAQLVSELKLALTSLISTLRSTGVGALPLLPPPMQPGSPLIPPDEQSLLATAQQNVNSLYESLARKQESAEVVASLIAQS